MGRSNVGKSSLINSLLGRKGLARTSSTPGRTQSLNFFLIDRRFHFVDLPGYGYAKISKARRDQWGEIITNYLANRHQLVLSIHVVDSRHVPSEQDAQLQRWFRCHSKPCLIIATKADKISKIAMKTSAEKSLQVMGSERLILYSAVTGLGLNEVWKIINQHVAQS